MIRVNLLPEASRKTVKKKARPSREIPVTWIIIGLVTVLVMVVVLAAVQWTFKKKADSRRQEIAELDVQIRKLGLEIEQVERFRAEKEDLEKKLNVIQQLKVQQKGPVHLLDQLASAVPPRLWLQEVAENGATITITGQALDHAQISTFMENLEKSPFFSKVELSSAVAGTLSGGKAVAAAAGTSGTVAKSFQITSNIEYPQEQL